MTVSQAHFCATGRLFYTAVLAVACTDYGSYHRNRDLHDANVEHAPDSSLDGDTDGSTRMIEDYRYTDPTGRMTINVRTCAPIGNLTQSAVCDAPDDFVLIGGGAEILENPEDPVAGAVLARSSPTAGCDHWAADWINGDLDRPVTVRAYSISIRLESRSRSGTYISADALRSARSCISARAPANGDAFQLGPSDGYLLVGGGASDTTFYSTVFPQIPPTVALVQSYPSNDGMWNAAAVNLVPELDGQMRAFVIGLLNPIPDFGSIGTNLRASSVSCGLGHVCILTDPFSSPAGVVASIGGTATYSGAGRYLSALKPIVETNGHPSAGVNVVTRDFVKSDESDNDPAASNQAALLILRATD